jgi:DNA-binding transcriptional regulator GbsR (MarR family)
MQLDEGRQKFIHAWGNLGINWGINKTMGQVHALLLVSSESLCADEVMEALHISRGNVNMNLRALIDWGLVHKQFKPGERKEWFVAEKDIWKVFQNIIAQRKKKELDPMIAVLNEISNVEANCEESDEFCKMIEELKSYSEKADSALTHLSESKGNWLMSGFMRMMR